MRFKSTQNRLISCEIIIKTYTHIRKTVYFKRNIVYNRYRKRGDCMNREQYIRQEIEKLGMSQTEFAKKNNIPPSSLNSMLQRDVGKASVDNVIKVCKGLGITVEELERLSTSTNERKSVMPVNEYPYFPTSVAAGLPTEAEPISKSDIIKLPSLVLGRDANQEIYFVHANGDSMDKIFPDGSLLAVKQVKTTSELCNGDIVVFSTNGDYSVKRFYKADDKLIFRPESHNPVHTDQIYSPQDEIHIHGKVVTYIVNL